MRLEQQVCSLDLAKRLKELGVRQKRNLAGFWWEDYRDSVNHPRKPERWELVIRRDGQPYANKEYCRAFTVAELGEMLPASKSVKGGIGWLCEADEDLTHRIFEADTEADARAKCLIYLIEKGIVKP